jgi:glutathione S-transferase
MKLYHSTTSPYVRKVMVAAIELGLADRIETVPAKVSPIVRTAPVIADNPLGKLPTLIADDGMVLFDSRVIAEHLDALAGGGRLIPASGPARWQALTEQALADGMLDAALLERYETSLRPSDLLWPAWRDGQHDKVAKALDRMEQTATGFARRVDIGTIATGCALAYLDFRFPKLGWRSDRPRLAAWYAAFAERPSMAATAPRD